MDRGRRGTFQGLPLLLVLFLGVGIFGCARRQAVTLGQSEQHLPARTALERVPFYAQDAHQCGPASLAMVLSWSGVPVAPDQLLSEVYSPARKGTLQPNLIAAARRHGRVAYPIHGVPALLSETAAGHPTIVLQNLGLSWFPRWHYSVVVGYDLTLGTITLHTGLTPFREVSVSVFENTWARSGYWGLLILEPSRFPATVSEETYLQAVLGLEGADQSSAAEIGYRTALTRWPGSLGALMGLGNSLYAQRDLVGAEEAFRQAWRTDPESGPALNNLAQVLYEQGRFDEALESARRAVAVGGPLEDLFRETLEAIESAKRPAPEGPAPRRP